MYKQKTALRLEDLKIAALRDIAKNIGIPNYRELKAQELIEVIYSSASDEKINQNIRLLISKKRKRDIRNISGRNVFFVIAFIIGFTQDWKGFKNDVIACLGYNKRFEYNITLKKDIPNILIMPFIEDGKSAENIGKMIHGRLDKKMHDDSLMVNVIYCDGCPIGANFSEDSAQYLLNEYKLDMIIFGRQLSDEISLSSQPEFRINYFSNPRHHSIFQNEAQDFNREYAAITFPEIYKGKLQEKVDYLILYLSALIYKNSGEPQKALRSYNYIFDSLGVKNDVITNELVFTNLQMMDSSAALSIVDRYIRSQGVPSISNWLALFTYKIAIYSHTGDLENLERTLLESETILSLFQFPKTEQTIMNFRRMGEFIAPYSPDRAIDFINDALKYAKELDIKDEIPKCYHELGRIYFFKQNYSQAIKMGNEALKLYDKNNLTHVWLIVKARKMIGISYLKLKRIHEGINEYNKAVKLIKATAGNAQLAVHYFELAEELFDIQAHREAIRYLIIGLKITEDLPQSKDNIILKTLFLVRMGTNYNEIVNRKEAVKLWSRAIQESKNIFPNYNEICPLLLKTHIELIETLEMLKQHKAANEYKLEFQQLSTYCIVSN